MSQADVELKWDIEQALGAVRGAKHFVPASKSTGGLAHALRSAELLLEQAQGRIGKPETP